MCVCPFLLLFLRIAFASTSTSRVPVLGLSECEHKLGVGVLRSHAADAHELSICRVRSYVALGLLKGVCCSSSSN